MCKHKRKSKIWKMRRKKNSTKKKIAQFVPMNQVVSLNAWTIWELKSSSGFNLLIIPIIFRQSWCFLRQLFFAFARKKNQNQIHFSALWQNEWKSNFARFLWTLNFANKYANRLPSETYFIFNNAILWADWAMHKSISAHLWPFAARVRVCTVVQLNEIWKQFVSISSVQSIENSLERLNSAIFVKWYKSICERLNGSQYNWYESLFIGSHQHSISNGTNLDWAPHFFFPFTDSIDAFAPSHLNHSSAH